MAIFSKNLKHKFCSYTQTLTFMPNFMKIRWNGEDFYYFEGFFWSRNFPNNPLIPNTNNAIFAESTPNAKGHREPTVWSWEVVEPILEIRNTGLSA